MELREADALSGHDMPELVLTLCVLGLLLGKFLSLPLLLFPLEKAIAQGSEQCQGSSNWQPGEEGQVLL